MKHILLSSSLTKELGLYVCDDELITTDHCPKLVRAKYIDDEPIDDISSEAMLQGKYFETKCLGSGRSGEVTDDLPRLKNGEKSAAHKRIDEQVFKFKKIIAERGMNINIFNTQMKLIAKYKELDLMGEKYTVWITGELDVFPTIIDYTKLAIVDLKLTKDVTNEFFTPSLARQCANGCWGSPQYIAKNQPLFYHFLVRNINLKHVLQYNKGDEEKIEAVITDQVMRLAQDATFYYLVFGSKAKTSAEHQYRVVEYKLTHQRELLFEQLVDNATQIYLENDRHGWQANPISEICKRCPIKCEFKNKDIEL